MKIRCGNGTEIERKFDMCWANIVRTWRLELEGRSGGYFLGAQRDISSLGSFDTPKPRAFRRALLSRGMFYRWHLPFDLLPFNWSENGCGIAVCGCVALLVCDFKFLEQQSKKATLGSYENSYPKSSNIVINFRITFSFNFWSLLERPELLFRSFLDPIWRCFATCAKSEKSRGVQARALKSRFWTLESTSQISVARGLAPRDIFCVFVD